MNYICTTKPVQANNSRFCHIAFVTCHLFIFVTNEEDAGSHLICAVVTNDFLQFSLTRGNDLITPRPEYRFPGLIAGDQWCLCINRWLEALDVNCAPLIKLESTNIKALELVSLNLLQQYSSEA
ncbi:DUF2237 family protein [Polynucleobacter necessarius]|uniref:DUF2237 family protein n=1 Tax=Polynucleobacter necessarius TaxID=576610 RepID=UPI0018D50179|nr:DUF2237 domain-containing protein [Polynucleobacter necessarius]